MQPCTWQRCTLSGSYPTMMLCSSSDYICFGMSVPACTCVCVCVCGCVCGCTCVSVVVQVELSRSRLSHLSSWHGRRVRREGWWAWAAGCRGWYETLSTGDRTCHYVFVCVGAVWETERLKCLRLSSSQGFENLIESGLKGQEPDQRTEMYLLTDCGLVITMCVEIRAHNTGTIRSETILWYSVTIVNGPIKLY